MLSLTNCHQVDLQNCSVFVITFDMQLPITSEVKQKVMTVFVYIVPYTVMSQITVYFHGEVPTVFLIGNRWRRGYMQAQYC